MIPPVVNQEWLAARPDVVLADVRHYLDGRSGRAAFQAGHLPGAVFVAMDEVLADPPTVANGRHPLPSPERFAGGLSALGIGDDTVVVAYDDAGGAMAGRLVWLLRILGHDAALLDGGLAHWAGELTKSDIVRDPQAFTPRQWPAETLADINDAASGDRVIDARAAERYRGDVEPMDPRSGHIPGAFSLPFGGNLDSEGRFQPQEALRERFSWLGPAAGVISYCGSGITACHNLIALEYAGLGRGRLYPGSWSQYAATQRPAATGD